MLFVVNIRFHLPKPPWTPYDVYTKYFFIIGVSALTIMIRFRIDFHCRLIFSMHTCIKFMFANEIEAIINGNRTEWGPIRSVIIRVINKIGRPCSGSPICLITSMITDQIGRHKVLLPINHNFNKVIKDVNIVHRGVR